MARIAFAEFDRPSLKLVVAFAHEHYGLVVQRLDGADTHRDRHRPLGEHQPRGDEKARPQPPVRIGQHHPRQRRLRIARPHRRDVGNAALDVAATIVRIDQHLIADANALDILPVDRQIDPDRRQIGDDERRLLLRSVFAERNLPIDHGAADRGLEIVDRQALIAFDRRQQVVFHHGVADALPDRADDSRETRRDLHDGFLIGAQAAVECQRIAQRGAAGLGEYRPGRRQLDVADQNPLGAMLVLLDVIARGRFRLAGRMGVRGRWRRSPLAISSSADGCGNDDENDRGRWLHRVDSRARLKGLPTRPSMVATATWTFCCASCSRSRDWTKLA